MDAVAQTQGLSKRFKDVLAVDNVSMAIPKGQIYGFVGQNGAGKTTFMRLLLGLLEPTAGTIALFGETGHKALRKARKRVSFLPTHSFSFPDLTVQENMEYFRWLGGGSDKASIGKALALLELEPYAKRRARDLSSGLRQRMHMAIALLNEPELLVLDEPMIHIDPIEIVSFRNLLKRLAQERQVTILMSSHILSELGQVADCIGYIHKGRLIRELTIRNCCGKTATGRFRWTTRRKPFPFCRPTALHTSISPRRAS